jgi:hypothetical protein
MYNRMLNSFSQLLHCLGEFMHLHERIGAAPPLSVPVELYSHFCLIIYRYLVEWLIRETILLGTQEPAARPPDWTQRKKYSHY